VSLERYTELLAPAARRGVPCLCLNPDRIMLTTLGQRFGAGRIAELYGTLGGPVEWIGKPHPAIYEAALDAIGPFDRARVIGIGDSIEHDVAGAAGIGAASALVLEGIAAGMDRGGIEILAARHGARPDFVLEAFAWDGPEANAGWRTYNFTSGRIDGNDRGPF
jgi:ribonucleotide monophosphatase NagD (HAD superfamily)